MKRSILLNIINNSFVIKLFFFCIWYRLDFSIYLAGYNKLDKFINFVLVKLCFNGKIFQYYEYLSHIVSSIDYHLSFIDSKSYRIALYEIGHHEIGITKTSFLCVKLLFLRMTTIQVNFFFLFFTSEITWQNFVV